MTADNLEPRLAITYDLSNPAHVHCLFPSLTEDQCRAFASDFAATTLSLYPPIMGEKENQ